MRRLLVLLAGSAAAVVLSPVPPAAALSCVGPEIVIDGASHVVVGRVVDAEDGRVLVAVDEVRTPSRVASQVWLAVQLDSWFGPADLEPGGPERVFAWNREAVVNPCTTWPTRSAEQYLAATAQQPVPVQEPHEGGLPEDVERGAAPPAEADELAVPAAVGAGISVLLVPVLVLLVGRRRAARP